MQKTTLGRGLSSLIPNANVNRGTNGLVSGEKVHQLPLERIVGNPQQPRERFERQGMEELVSSIKQHGILQPLVVTETPRGYELIAGERRLRAAKIAGLSTVPAIVRSATNQQKLELAIVENVQRKDLNPLERAKGYKHMLGEFSMTQEDVAKKVGQSRSSVANILRLLTLPEDMQAAIMDGKITEGHAKVLLGVTDPKARQQLFKKILTEGLSVRAVEDERTVDVRSHKRTGISAELQTKASRLGAALGTKVKISPKGRGGVLHVDYADAEELEGIVRKVEGRG
jgi:ParB family chromosome partitioning protein